MLTTVTPASELTALSAQRLALPLSLQLRYFQTLLICRPCSIG